VRALGACHCGRGHELILRCFANADEPSIRFEAVRALGTIRTRYARTMLNDLAVEHPDAVIRENAVRCLNEFGDSFDVNS
jgi:HEAT repeat protein